MAFAGSDLASHLTPNLMRFPAFYPFSCQHRYKTTAFPPVLLLGREAYGEDVVRTL